MTTTKYFVVAIGGRGKPVPIMEFKDEFDTEEIALYTIREEAVRMAEEQPLCSARGYEVYKWDNCEAKS